MDSKLPEKIDLASIRPFIDSVELRKQLIHQLEKDLPNIELSVSPTQDKFFLQVSSILQVYIHKAIDIQPNSLPQLLYKIDVSERKIRDNLRNTTDNSANQIAHLILEKEVQKVFIRNVYNGNISL